MTEANRIPVDRRAWLKVVRPPITIGPSGKTPILDGRPMAFHCSELAFVFDGTDRCAAMTGGGPEVRELGGKISDAWINFAKRGNPNHKGLPKWAAFDKGTEPTMIFNTKCEVRNDPAGPERRLANEEA